MSGTQIYHIHSSDARWVTQQREALLSDLIPDNMRDENLLELFATSSKALRLTDILPELIGELSTIPFLPDSRRVVVAHNLADFLASGGGRKPDKPKTTTKGKKRLSPAETLAAFVERDLPATTNVLVFSTIIEVERGQRFDPNNPLSKFIHPPIGRDITPARRENDPIFQMSDALLRRDAVGCLRHFRVIYRDDARGRIFHEILRNIRFLLQSKILKTVEAKSAMSRDIIEMKYLPNDKRLNLYKQHKFVQEKIQRAASNFNLRELMIALECLLEINSALIPSQKDLYAADVELMLETFLISFCEGAVGAGRVAR